MKPQIENLGKISVTVEQQYWTKDRQYDRLTIVEDIDTIASYISRKDVPSGIDINNREYWIPLGRVSDYLENFVEEERGTLLYLEEAVRNALKANQDFHDTAWNNVDSLLNDLNETITNTLNTINSTNNTVNNNEVDRVTAENKRITAENERVTQENERTAAEALRQNTERNREIAEEERQRKYTNEYDAYENNRRNAETLRNAAESARQEQEAYRISNEESRQDAEAIRQGNENIRNSSETSRQQGEQARVIAENARVTNENIRVTAENNRQLQEGNNSDKADVNGSRWARYKNAENIREQKFNEAQTIRNTQFTTTQTNRQEAYETAETERWNNFEEAESRRDEEVEDAVSILDTYETKLNNKANIDGSYSTMTVGAAETLLGHNIVTVKYTYRPTADTTDVADGVAKISSVKGNTIVWNQLDKNCGPYNNYGIILTPNDDDTFTFNGTATTNFEIYNILNNGAIYKDLPIGHKGLFKLNHISGEFTTGIKFIYDGTLIPINAKTILSTRNNYRYLLIQLNEGCVIDNAKFSFQVFDLSQMFGEGNEPTVEEFEAMFPNEYYEYNEGELKSIEDFQIKSVGFNQWDEKWELGTIATADGRLIASSTMIRSVNFIKVLPNTNYRYTFTPNTANRTSFVYCYDDDYKYISYKHNEGTYNTIIDFTTPKNCAYIKFVEQNTTVIDNTHRACINLSHTGIRNGEYEPYQEDILPINISTIKDENGEVLFPNGLCSAGEAHDELVYDKSIGKWKAVKRIGSVDMGILAWTYYDGSDDPEKYPYGYNQVHMSSRKPGRINLLQIKYKLSYRFTIDKILYPATDQNTIYIIDSSYTDEESFKQSLQGQILYYELAEPIEVVLDDFASNYKVSDWGTEEIIMDSTPIVPVIYDVEYALNAVDTLRNMPTNYISKESLDAFLSTLGSAMGGTWTATYNETNGRYDFTFSANASATELIDE